MARRPTSATEPAPPVDLVNHPPHYTQQEGGIECIDAIAAALGPEGFVAFLRGQVIKYTWRMMHKGNATQDAQKAAWYNQKLIDVLQERD